MKMKKIFLILILAVGISIVPNFHLIAQNPINMTLVKTGPHSSHLDNVDDFLEKIILTTQEVVGKPIDFNLKITVTGPNDMNVLIEKALTEAISLNEHQALTVTGLDMEDYGLLDNVSSEDINPPSEREFLESGRILREGHYIICMTAIDIEYPYEELSLPACYEYDIEYGDAPIINIPEMNDTIVALDPPAQFNVAWEHNPIGGYFNLDYNVRIIDITPYPYSDPNELMDQPGIASLLDEDKPGVLSTFFDDIDFEINHKYGLRVTATDPDDEMVFKNGGRSNVVVFVYGDEGSEEDTYTTYSNTINCFYLPPAPILDDNPTTNLVVGDILKIGSFDMTVKSISINSGNTFSGTGEISISFLNDIKITTEFTNIKKNNANEIFSGDVVAVKDNTINYQKYQTNAIGMEDSQLEVLNEVLDQTARLVSAYNGDASIGLPIAWDKEFGSDPVKIAILDMKFTPTGATLDALVDLDVSSLGDDNLQKIVLGVSDLAFSGGSIESEAKLFLAQDLNLQGTGGDVILGGAKDAGDDLNNITYAEWDCKGFKNLNVSLDYEFPRSIAVPENDNGSNKVIAHSNLKMDDGFSWLGQINIPPFQIAGMPDGFSFEVDEAWIDYSTTNNIDEFINNIPSNYDDDALNSNNPQIQNTWKGFWIKDLKIKLPDYFGSGSDKIKTSLQNFIYDGKFTFTFLVEDILTLNEGKSLAGSEFSIDKLSMNVLQNNFEQGGLNGKIGLPITDDFLDYSATFSTAQNNNSLVFNLQPAEDVKIPMFLANATIQKTSSFDLTVDNSTELSFDINAKIDIAEDFAPSNFDVGPFSANIPGIDMEHLKYSSESGFDTDSFRLSLASPQKSISGFPFSLGSPELVANSNIITLKLHPQLTLTKAGGGGGISAGVGIDFISNISNFDGIKKVKLDKVNITEISVDADISSVHINGKMQFYNENGSKGTKGSLTVDLPSNIQVELNAEFGTYKNQDKPDAEFDTKDWYDYWFLDGMLIYENGIAIYEPYLKLYGLGGGVYYHMTQSNVPEDLHDDSNDNSGCNYSNDFETHLGLKFKGLFGSTNGGKAYNFDVAVSAEFNEKWGMRYFALDGNVRIMAKDIRDEQTPIYGNMKIAYEDKDNTKSLSGKFDIFVNLANGKVKGIGNNNFFVHSVFYIDDDIFMFNMGTPARRNGLAVNPPNAIFTSYLMVGDSVPSMLPPPTEAFLEIFNDGPSDYTATGQIKKVSKIKDASGFAFGASYTQDKYESNPVPFYFTLGITAGFDINFTHISARSCGVGGWYAQGQIYAAIKADFGIEVDLRFIHCKKSILNASAALILKGGLPNPYYAQGSGIIRYSILGGKVKGTFQFDVTYGDKCVNNASAAELLAEIELIQDMKPDEGASEVSIYSLGTATFAFPIDEVMEIPVDDEKTRKFEPFIDSWDIYKGGQKIESYPEKLHDENYVGSIMPHFLEGETLYKQKLKVKVREVFKNGSKKVVNQENSNSDWFQEKTYNFTTGPAPDSIVEENIIFTYPYKNQSNFLKGETKYNNGNIVLKQYSPQIFPKRTGMNKYSYYARFIPVNSGEVTHIDNEIIIEGDRLLSFNVSALQNSTTYALQVIQKKHAFKPPIPSIQTNGDPITKNMVKTDKYYEDINTGQRIYISDEDDNENSKNWKYKMNNGNMLSGNNLNNKNNGVKHADDLSFFELINRNSVFIKKRELKEITTIKKNEKKLYEYYFRTSKYNTFKEKVQNANWNAEVVSEYGHDTKAVFETGLGEPLDYYDVYKYKHPKGNSELYYKKEKSIQFSFNIMPMSQDINTYYQYVYQPNFGIPNFRIDNKIPKIEYLNYNTKNWEKCSYEFNNVMIDKGWNYFNDFIYNKSQPSQLLTSEDIDYLLNHSDQNQFESSIFGIKMKIVNAFPIGGSYFRIFLRGKASFLLEKKYEVEKVGEYTGGYASAWSEIYTLKEIILKNMVAISNNTTLNEIKTTLNFNELEYLLKTLAYFAYDRPDNYKNNFPRNSSGRLRPITFRMQYSIPKKSTNPNNLKIDCLKNDMKNIQLIIATIILSFFNLQAQELSKESIYIIAKRTNAKVVLRWAPTTAGVWHRSKHAGYQLERMSYKDSTDFLKARFAPVTKDPIKPWPLEKWEPIADETANDRYATIAAQILYGDNKQSEGSIFKQAKKFKNLYSIALLAADLSVNAATASGLRYEDMDINPELTYIYRIRSLASTDSNPIMPAIVVVRKADLYKEVEISLKKPIEGERAVTIQWGKSLNDEYTAWYIEKSSDGKIFTRLNEVPFIDSDDGKLEKSDFMSYTDSVNTNYIPYYYRIIGIDAFADLSKPSNVVVGMGRDKTPPQTPKNVKAKQIAEGKMKITWQAVDDGDLNGFMISRKNEIDGQESAVTNKMLSKMARSYIDTEYDPLQHNWYMVYAIDSAKNASISLPEYGEIRDSIPPNAPTGLRGEIDSNGVVIIKWDLGKERDLYGYNVYYANAKDHVFTNLTNTPIDYAGYIDTISLKTLTEHIFYRVVAFDQTRNASEFSEILDLKKPDIVPPVAPLFTDYKVTKEGINLKWANSSSKDAETHYLYREVESSNDWKLIYRSSDKADYGHYTDKGTIPNTKYRYKLEVVDDDGLKTVSDYILSITVIDYHIPPPVKSLSTKYNKVDKSIKVSWNYSMRGDYKFALYRAVNGTGFKLLKPIDSDIHQYIDKDIKLQNSYEYVIKVLYPNGKKSGFSPIKKIRFKLKSK